MILASSGKNGNNIAFLCLLDGLNGGYSDDSWEETYISPNSSLATSEIIS
ncbi:MAG: hypothetical protein IEMM0006_1133 [bacterium]|nr:MAG: hypothetical protein IEMM0006_1133 [bacterium]